MSLFGTFPSFEGVVSWKQDWNEVSRTRVAREARDAQRFCVNVS